SGKLQASADGGLHIGELSVTGTDLPVGQDVVLRGDLRGMVLEVRDLRRDLSMPFSTAVQHLSVQAEGPLLEAELSRASATTVRRSGELLRRALEPSPPVRADGDVRVGTTFSARGIRPAAVNLGGLSRGGLQEPARSERLPDMAGPGHDRPQGNGP